MKRIILGLLLVMAMSCVVTPICCALEVNSNGYDWNSADNKDKVTVCKQLASKMGKPYAWWIENLDAFYDSATPFILKVNIYQAATLIGAQQRGFEKRGE